MGKRENIKTTPKQIVEYWESKVDELDISVDWCEAQKCCWRCGLETNLQRAHIIPDSLGGKDEPSNLILLCGRCHGEAPNVADPEIMWEWLKAYNTHSITSLGVLMALREYKFIYKNSFTHDAEYILNKANITEESESARIKEDLFSIGKGTSTHFGQQYLNTATLVGMMRMFLKDLALKHGVEFPVKNDDDELSFNFLGFL